MKFVYSGEKLKKIEFPIGGIGTGNVSLTGIGELINWEFYSMPNKESRNEFSHFAIKAEQDGKVLDARVLQGDIQEDYYGHGFGCHHSWGYGYGPTRTTMAGFPHFRNTSFEVQFPFAEIEFQDEKFPGNVELEAFNPFIPSNDRDSSIPAAFFRWKLHNTTSKSVTYTVAFAAGNPLMDDTVNECIKNEIFTGIRMSAKDSAMPKQYNGTVCVLTDAANANVQEYWYRGHWFDELTVYWQDFITPGPIAARHYSQAGHADMSVTAASITLKPFESGELRFVLSWYVPYFIKTWGGQKSEGNPYWKNYYTKLFNDHEALNRYVFAEWERLEKESRLFAITLASSSMPQVLLEAVSANLSILKSPTCLRLENGEFYGFEGTNRNSGSCEGSCDHVWNYAYALPYLFPKLERSMRELDYTYNQMENGGVQFRLMLPLGSPHWDFRPCVDGEMGGVLKFYRDWKICGDDLWLKKWWPKVQKSLEYAWNAENLDRWDPNHTGVISGRQHHTLDTELFGPNSWLEGYYIAALMAASEICEYLGEKQKDKEYRRLAEAGRRYTEENLFNGKYYIQKVDLEDKNYIDKRCGKDENAKSFYWDEEKKQIKYQYKEGCEIDQMTAQWHASLIGLGDVYDRKHRRIAIRNLYKNNFKTMREITNPCRIFSVNDEKGLVICTWPKDVNKPRIPLPYSEETMAGYEYAAAGLLLQEGFIDEAINVVTAIRERYDGNKRNPFSELECGSSYARSMASYALLLIYSGFRVDMTKKQIRFAPVIQEETMRFFWSLDGAWGNFVFENGIWQFHVLYGKLELREFDLPGEVHCIRLNSDPLDFLSKTGKIVLKEEQQLCKGDTLFFFMK